MAADERFYRVEEFVCPLCDSILVRDSRTAQPDSLKLTHRKNSCKRSGRVYYYIGVDLTPMPKEFQ